MAKPLIRSIRARTSASKASISLPLRVFGGAWAACNLAELAERFGVVDHAAERAAKLVNSW